ncbi:hypothetical protein, partial [Nocardia gipuzkoensis]|uniref:hypothetical protein n=1 Tax=Nocardia gipuzkoensis TaxID=2749991 RepID=UPI0024581EFF
WPSFLSFIVVAAPRLCSIRLVLPRHSAPLRAAAPPCPGGHDTDGSSRVRMSITREVIALPYGCS